MIRADDSIIRLYDSAATPCGCEMTKDQAKRILRRYGRSVSYMNSGGVPFTSVRRIVGPTDTLLTCLSCGVRWMELRGHGPADQPPTKRPIAISTKEQAA